MNVIAEEQNKEKKSTIPNANNLITAEDRELGQVDAKVCTYCCSCLYIHLHMMRINRYSTYIHLHTVNTYSKYIHIYIHTYCINTILKSHIQRIQCIMSLTIDTYMHTLTHIYIHTYITYIHTYITYRCIQCGPRPPAAAPWRCSS